MPVKNSSVLVICRGLLLTWTSLIGVLGGLFLCLAWLFSASGFGDGQVYTGFGDGTMTASQVEKAQAETLSMGMVVLLAVAAVVVVARWRKHRHSTWILLGIASAQVLSLVVSTGTP